MADVLKDEFFANYVDEDASKAMYVVCRQKWNLGSKMQNLSLPMTKQYDDEA